MVLISACVHDQNANDLQVPCIAFVEQVHGILLQGSFAVDHIALYDGISVSTQHGTCIPISCGLDIVCCS